MTQYDPKPSWSLKRRSISVRSDPSRFRRRSIGPRALGIDNHTIALFKMIVSSTAGLVCFPMTVDTSKTLALRDPGQACQY
jgi:hypothetical protein